MSNLKLTEFYMFEISIKTIDALIVVKVLFLEFQLLLGRVAPYFQFVTTICSIRMDQDVCFRVFGAQIITK